MKFLIILCVIVIISAKESEKNEAKCEGILVHNKFHRKEVIGKGINRPYQLSYDQSDHRVYFSYNIGKDEEDLFEIGYLVKGHHEHKVMNVTKNGFATAIDNKNKVLYIGGEEGVFKKHLEEKLATEDKLISKDNIWDIFFRDHLYFITYPKQKLHKIVPKQEGKVVKEVTERVQHIHERIYQFAVDGDHDIFITNDTGLFKIKNGTDHRIRYEGPTVFRAIEINNKGKAYFSAQNAIYVANKTSHSLEKIAHIKNIFGITFDSDDNIIYSDPHEIVKLMPEDCK